MGFVLNTDFSTIEPDEGGNAKRMLPVSDSRGWLVSIASSEGKETNAKDGTKLDMVLSGLEGTVQGKSYDWSINVANPSQKAVEIGMGQLSAVAHVTGHTRVGNSAEWHGKPFRVVVEVDQKADLEKYPNSTRITKILDVNGNSAKNAGQGVMGGNAAPQGQSQAGQNWGNAGANAGTAQSSGQGFTQGNGGQPSNNGQNAQASASPSNQQPVQNFQPQQGQQFNQQPQGQQFQQAQTTQQFQQPQGGAGPGWNQ